MVIPAAATAAVVAVGTLCSPPAEAQIKYENSGRPWIDTGRAYYDEEHDQFADSRQLTQVWKVYPESKQVLYWWRFVFTPRHVAYMKKKDPYWGHAIDPRKPVGPYVVECGSEKGTVSTVWMEPGWTSPVINPIGEGYSEAGAACLNAGFDTSHWPSPF